MRILATGSEDTELNLTPIELGGSPEDVAAETLDVSSTISEMGITGMRASSLYGCCTRQIILGTKLQVSTRERLTLGEKLTFGIGNAVHSWIQNDPALFGDNRYGWWACTACHSFKSFGSPPKVPCDNCGAQPTAFIYEEHHVYTPEPFECSGHPDLFIKKRHNRLRLVEIKTIAADAFKALVSPKVKHVWQVQYYMWACSHDPVLSAIGPIDPHVGYVLYVSKGALYKTLPLKMFVEKRNDRIIERIKDKLLEYSDGKNNGNLPEPLDDCINSEFSRGPAGGCPVNTACSEEFSKAS